MSRHISRFFTSSIESSEDEMTDEENKSWEDKQSISQNNASQPSSTVDANSSGVNRFLLQYQNLYAPLNALSTHHASAFRFVTKQIQICLKALEQLAKKEKSLTKEQMEKNKKVFVTKLRDAIKELKSLEKKRNEAFQLVQLREDYLRYAPDSKLKSDTVWRLIIDYCAREGQLDIAQSLLNRLKEDTIILSMKNGENTVEKYIQFGDTISLDVYNAENEILNEFNQFSCTRALQWCEDHKTLLKKIGSSLHFELCLQEFIELVRQEKLMDAIVYARQHFEYPNSVNISKVKQAMGSIAYGPNTKIQPYANLFSSERWSFLKEMFKKDNRMIHSLTLQAELLLYMQAGISALNTPIQIERTNRDDPFRHQAVRILSKDLPYSFHDRTLLKCPISGEIINDSNPPISLPNGNVYGLKSIQEFSDSNGVFEDPKTMESFSYNEMKKCFIMNSW